MGDVGEQAHQGLGVGRGAQSLTEVGIGKPFGQLRQQHQMLMGVVRRHGHGEDHVHRLVPAERHRRVQPQQGAAWLSEIGAAPMRNGDAVADGSTAQGLALAQVGIELVGTGLTAGQQVGGGAQDGVAIGGRRHHGAHGRHQIG